MLDVTKPVQTRDGREARILEPSINLGWDQNQMVVVTKNGHDSKFSVGTRFLDGRKYGTSESENDIINVPEKPKELPWAEEPETALTVELVRKLVPKEYAETIRAAILTTSKLNETRSRTGEPMYTADEVLLRSKIDRLLFLAHFDPGLKS